MTKAQFINGVTRTFYKVGFKVRKHSPEILVAAGVVGVVASGVMACKATLKVDQVTEQTKKDVTRIHEATEKGVTAAGEKYSVEDSKKDLTIVYAQTGLKFAKLYGPSVVLGAASIACILTSHKILRTRNVALAAAYTAVDQGFKDYRKRVVERFGEELDRELKYNIKAKEVEETVVDENGEEKVVKKTVNVVDSEIPGYSPYAKFYDDGCEGWTKDPELNLMFLIRQQNYANEKLQKKGYLFLNEVYEMLGIQKTQAGQIVGWTYDKNCPQGDNYVDFGIYDTHKEGSRDFVNGIERTILLDFNVDGDITYLFA